MSQSVYSYQGSRLHLLLEDDIADGYNRFIAAFFRAQADYETRMGQKWNPSEFLIIDAEDEDLAAHTKVVRVLNLLVEINGGHLDIREEDFTSDYLEKL